MAVKTIALVLLLGCFGAASAMRARAKAGVTPVDQVITLLQDLQAQTETEGSEEAATYDTFACFCKDTTQEKSEALLADQTEIESQSATMAEKDTLRLDLEKEIEDLNTLLATIAKEMSDAETQRDADRTKYEATAADLANAVTSINGAIDEVKSKKAVVEGFTQLKASVRKSLVIADVLDMSPKNQRTLNALLQEEDDGVPENDVEFHGDALLSTMADLAKNYEEKKASVDEEEAKAVSAHNDYMAAKTNQRTTAEGDLTTKTEDLAQCNSDLGAATTALQEAKAMLTDDEQYMKDLTAKCELKAKEFDQRSRMRADELAALAKALAVMTEKVKVKSDQANKRALVQRDDSYIAPDAAPAAVEQQKEDVDDDDVGEVGFLQLRKSPHHKIGSLLKAAQTRHAQTVRAEQVEAAKIETPLRKAPVVGNREDRVLEMIRDKGMKLKSPVLSSLAMKIASDPFVKVKKLIQGLIEKLVTEASDEASQKGFCDTELAKATSTRSTEHTKVSKFNAAVEAGEAKRDKLEDDIASLTTELAELNDSLTKTTAMRAAEKEENLDTLTKATEGLDAVTEAIGILNDFYKGAAKGKVLLQVSPVDTEAPDSASGAYQGNQAATGGIMGMMAVIKSDFERTIKTTKADEYEAARSFAEFDTTTKSSISAKETAKSMFEGDLANTNTAINRGMADLTEHMKLLDDVLKTFEDLKPACIDTGMSFSERVAKREDEIEALKTAMCMLDADGVEEGC